MSHELLDRFQRAARAATSYEAYHAIGAPMPEGAYNIAEACLDHWAHAEPDRVALRFDDTPPAFEGPAEITFGRLASDVQAMAGRLAAAGLRPREVVAVWAGQQYETVLTHLAAYRLGAIVATISLHHGPATVRHILADSGARLAVVARERLTLARELFREQRAHDGVDVDPAVQLIPGGAELFDPLQRHADADDPPPAVATSRDDPALLLYTSGSTGRPKGVLHAHRMLPAYLPSVASFCDLHLDTDAVLYTPFDWAYVGGLLDALLPGLVAGATVIGREAPFQPRAIWNLLARFSVTHAVIVASALKQLTRTAPHQRPPLPRLRLIATGGEKTPPSLVHWTRRELGVPLVDFYGLTEVNHLVGNCPAVFPIRPGSIGKPYPGHRVAILGDDGRPVAPGEVGQIATHRSDPTMSLGYWNQPEADAELWLGAWRLTGDLGTIDDDGYLHHLGRGDDLIKSAGHRISPTEIEDVLHDHPSVAQAAVLGWPDEARGQAVKAVVQLRDGVEGDATRIRELQAFVRDRLGAARTPRVVEFVDRFELTSTGKVRKAALRPPAASEPPPDPAPACRQADHPTLGPIAWGDTQPDRGVAAFTPDRPHASASGEVETGPIATLVEQLACRLGPTGFITARLDIRHRAPARVGVTLTATLQLRRRRAAACLYVAEVRDADRRLIADARLLLARRR